MSIRKITYLLLTLLITTASTTLVSSFTPSLGEVQVVVSKPARHNRKHTVHYTRMGQTTIFTTWDELIKQYEQKFLIARLKKDGNALINLALIYSSFFGDYPKTIECYQQSLKIFREMKDRMGEGNALGNLGNTYAALEDYPKTIECYQQSLKIFREMKYRRGEGGALTMLGYTLYKQGNFKLAETTLYDAIKLLESLRGNELKDMARVRMFEPQNKTYRILEQVLIAQNKYNTALEIAERGRGRVLVELLAGKLSLKSQQLPTPPTIAEIKQIAKTQNATLVQYSIISDDFKVKGRKQFKESELYIWVIKPTGEVIFRKSDLKPFWQKENIDLASLVDNSRASIGARGRGIEATYNPNGAKISAQGTQKLKQLHELLIRPIEDLLPSNENERVVFIPQASLFLVPFPALQDSKGKYLIEKHTISTAPAIQILDLTHQQKQRVTGKGALIVGNPTIAPQISSKYGLVPLDGAEQEAIKIGKILNSKPILTNQATKPQVLQKIIGARIIHLATHGLLDDTEEEGIPGAVVLAPSAKDYGLLTSGDILDLKLDADLVVLSACDTGQGNLTEDGVIGLSSSLISAGASSVIVTLWKIPDQATSVLMTDFYQNLQHNPDKAVALRKAMLKTMKQYPNPINWGAFTLVGEAQ
jgi:CHAT domain-containing protein